MKATYSEEEGEGEANKSNCVFLIVEKKGVILTGIDAGSQ